jgi:hypothetical protein
MEPFGWGKPVEHGLPLPFAEPEQAAPLPSQRPVGAPQGDSPRGAVPFPQAPNPFATGSAPNLPPMPSFPSAPESGSPVNSPWLALMQAGLGTLAASGHRDANGLPMSGLAAIGQGGLSGVKTLQEQQAAALKERQQQVHEKEFLDQAAMRRLPYTTLTAEQKVQAAQAARPYTEMTQAQKEQAAQAARPYTEMTAAQTAQNAFERERLEKPYTSLTAAQDAQNKLERDRLERPYAGMTAAQKASNELETKKYELQAQTPIRVGSNIWGQPVYGVRDPKTGQTLDVTTGKPINVAELGEASEESLRPMAKAIAHYNQAPLSPFKAASPVGAALTKMIQEENPDYDSKRYASANKAKSAFAAGQEGRTTRAMNVSIDHLSTLEELSTALQNGDVQAINTIKNAWNRQFGSEIPTNFDAAKDIVGAEITKAVIGGQTALTDRQELRDQLSKASSPAQLAGVIRTFKKLLAGQLGGLKKQYETETGAKDFDDKLSDAAKRELGGLGNSGEKPKEGRVKVSSPEEARKLPPGTKFETPDGQTGTR